MFFASIDIGNTAKLQQFVQNMQMATIYVFSQLPQDTIHIK